MLFCFDFFGCYLADLAVELAILLADLMAPFAALPRVIWIKGWCEFVGCLFLEIASDGVHV
jgi:hypothetical protein